ncbi:hypothetical protein L9F63_006687, partial [Diploptera punctata]
PAPQIDIPPQVVSAPSKEAALDCTVRSQLRYNLTWARSSLESSVLPQPEGNGSNLQLKQHYRRLDLYIENAESSDAGKYDCVAENDNDLSGPDGTLTINNAEATDSGEYTCIAENKLGISQHVILLNVGIPRNYIQIEIYNNGTLPCIAIGPPTPNISWIRKDGKQLNQNSTQITQHGNLVITHAGKDDEGSYICKVTNIFGHAEHEAQVHITGIVKPVLNNKNGNHPMATVKRGMLVELPCQVVLSNPPAVISWYKDGEILDEEQMQWEGITVFSNGSLVISYTTQEHEGTYECIATNIGGSVSVATTLHVLESPSFPPAAKVEFKVRAGEEAVLPCPALGVPDPMVTWKKDEMPIPLNHMIYKNDEDNSLVITSANVADTGTYECTAINPAGEAKRAMALFIQVPPFITPGEEFVDAVEGHSLL